MENKDIFDIWDQGNKELLKNDKTSKAMIHDYLNKKALKTSVHFNVNILFYLFIQLVNVIFCSMNIVAYKMNPVILYVLIGSLVMSLAVLIYGTVLFIQLREIKNFSKSLSDLINDQLKFVKVKYEIWMIIISFTVLILIFNVNISVDYNNGYYPINNKLMYIGINLIVFVFNYIGLKVTGFRFINELKAYLSDLKNGVLDKSQNLEKGRKRLKLILIGIMIFFLLTALLGLLKATGII